MTQWTDMDNIPAIIPAPRRKLRRRKPGAAAPTPPAGPPVLTAATYDNDAATLTLVFDRAIDIAAYDGNQVKVDDDQFTGYRYLGTSGAALTAPTTVQITLERQDSAIGSGVHLLASSDSGIVSAGDGSEWEGASNLALPFP
jgi:hypothetical protein